MILEEEELDQKTLESTIENLREIFKEESGKSYHEIRRELITDMDFEEGDEMIQIMRDYYDKAAIEILGYKIAGAEILADEYMILLKGDYVSPEKTRVKKEIIFN